jgi:hypothetical protein
MERKVPARIRLIVCGIFAWRTIYTRHRTHWSSAGEGVTNENETVDAVRSEGIFGVDKKGFGLSGRRGADCSCNSAKAKEKVYQEVD